MGVVLGGCSGTNLHDFYYLTSPVIDTSGATGSVFLGFERWLNSDIQPYMKSVVQVFDGAAWHTILETGTEAVSDAYWRLFAYDVTAYKSASMRARFGFAITSGGVISGGSWTLDDITVTAAACQ